MPEAGDDAPHAAVVADMRAVGVSLLVGVRMVLAMVGNPGDHGSLHGHRAEHGEGIFQRLEGLKGAVREQAVKANRYADRGEQVQRRGDRQVADADQVVPEQHDRRERSEEGNHDGAEVGDLLSPGHFAHSRQLKRFVRIRTRLQAKF